MISTRGRYALRVMLDLAENETGSYIPLKDIAARQDVSKKYLEIIVKDMVAGGLITGASGKGGGYKLCRRPEEYSVGEILNLQAVPETGGVFGGRDSEPDGRIALYGSLPGV